MSKKEMMRLEICQEGEFLCSRDWPKKAVFLVKVEVKR